MMLALVIGILSGSLFGWWGALRVVTWTEARSGLPWLAIVGPLVGAAIAWLPSLFVAVVGGGEMGARFGSAVMGAAGEVVGIGLGVAVLAAMGISVGACAAALLVVALGRLLGRRPNNSSKPTPLRGAA